MGAEKAWRNRNRSKPGEIPHVDTGHIDTTNTVGHVDTAHVDVPAVNFPGIPNIHIDGFPPVVHNDGYTGHIDTPHTDTAHADTPAHNDHADAGHGDASHGDKN